MFPASRGQDELPKLQHENRLPLLYRTARCVAVQLNLRRIPIGTASSVSTDRAGSKASHLDRTFGQSRLPAGEFRSRADDRTVAILGGGVLIIRVLDVPMGCGTGSHDRVVAAHCWCISRNNGRQRVCREASTVQNSRGLTRASNVCFFFPT